MSVHMVKCGKPNFWGTGKDNSNEWMGLLLLDGARECGGICWSTRRKKRRIGYSFTHITKCDVRMMYRGVTLLSYLDSVEMNAKCLQPLNGGKISEKKNKTKTAEKNAALN